MALYDSDSSDDGLDVQTNVTLGYVAEESTGDDISHVGGLPTWMDNEVRPPADLVKCKVCNNFMSLLLQLQADLQQQFPDAERRLFVWCCRRKQCSKKTGSIRAFREVKRAKATRKTAVASETTISSQPPRTNLGSQLFGGLSSPQPTNTNPFSVSATQTKHANPFSSSHEAEQDPFSELAAIPPQPPTQSFADKLKISSPQPQPEDNPSPSSSLWPADDSFPTPFPQSYLDAESEYLDSSPPDSGPSNSRIQELKDDEEAPGKSSAVAAEKDLYESPHDRTFDHFTRILSQNPEQVLRYEFGGQPLLYSSTDGTATHFVLPGHNLHQTSAKVRTAGPVKGVPSCQHCGSERVFELQLTPYLIYELEKDDEQAMKLDGGEGMDWGTIIVGSCAKNCGDQGRVVFKEEWVGVQWEEGGVELKAQP